MSQYHFFRLLSFFAALLAPALQVAIATNRTVYDSLHLALTIELGGIVLTADERWINALKTSPFTRFIRPLSER